MPLLALLLCINSQIARGNTIGQNRGAINKINQENLSFLVVVESIRNRLNQKQKSINAIIP